jgi:DNA-binding XRE family transcriptional regulator
LVETVTAAAGLTLENERLQAELRARLAELQASRARLVEATESTGGKRLTRQMRNRVRELRTETGCRRASWRQRSRCHGTINSIETERYTPSLPLALALARYFGIGWPRFAGHSG